MHGEIWWAVLDEVRRPVLVVSRDEVNRLGHSVLALPGVGVERVPAPLPVDFLVTAEECGLPKDTLFLALGLRPVPVAQLEARAGRLAPERLPDLWDRLRYLLGDDR